MFTPFAFVKESAVAPALWTPADITTLVWFDAEDTGTITLNGSTVSQWDDKSGNGYNATQSGSTLQPAYGTNQLNGIDILTFDATDDVMNFGLVNYTDQSLSIFFLGNRTSRDGSYSVNIVVKKAQPSNAVCLLIDPNANLGGRYWGAYTYNSMYANLASYSNNNWEIFEQVTNTSANNCLQWLTGNSQGSNPSGLFNGTSVFNSGVSIIGTDQYGSAFGGDVAEIVVVDGVISQTDREKMEGYMAWKWGLEGDLPAGHPYKSAPPTA